MQKEHNTDVTFTFSGALAGARKSLPIVISVFAYGNVFGMLARQTGLSLLESVFMSMAVFAGAAQTIVLGLWLSPLPVAVILVTTLIVNLRHILMGASLHAWFSRITKPQAYTTLFFLSDESWALSMPEYTSGAKNAAFMLGVGLMLMIAWATSTVTGYLAGAFIGDPTRWGLDFAFIAVFLVLIMSMWKGKSDLLPWLVAGVVALVTYWLIPGKWYILSGGLAGSLVGAWRDAK